MTTNPNTACETLLSHQSEVEQFEVHITNHQEIKNSSHTLFIVWCRKRECQGEREKKGEREREKKSSEPTGRVELINLINSFQPFNSQFNWINSYGQQKKSIEAAIYLVIKCFTEFYEEQPYPHKQ